MRTTPHRLLALTLAIATLSLMSATTASAKSGPVIDSFWISLWSAVAMPNDSPKGANDWTCKPSAAHPRPVILIHGTYSNMFSSFSNLALPLKREGYCVFALNYGTYKYGLGVFPAIKGLAPIQNSAEQLGVFTDRVLAATGAGQVDLVGFSQGGLVAREYLKFKGGADAADPSKNKVRTLVGLVSANRGGTAGGLSDFLKYFGFLKRGKDVLGPSSLQMIEGSPFLVELNAGGDTVPGVDYTMIGTTFDEINVPWDHAFLKAGPGATVHNVLLQYGCARDLSDHFSTPYSKRTHGLVLKALDPGYAKPIPCANQLPV